MILNYQHTTTTHISSEMNRLRGEGGVITLGRVLTLVIVTQNGHEDEAIATAISASREHPCRIIVLAPDIDDTTTGSYMDAQIRLGSDSGAGEVIIIYGHGDLEEPTESLISALILPDIPIVVWWHIGVPEDASATSLGTIAHRRITDTSQCTDAGGVLTLLSKSYVKGNTDLAWTRTTLWRTQLVAALDQVQEPWPVKSLIVEGGLNSSSTLLLAAWLHQKLDAPLTLVENPSYPGIHRVSLSFANDAIDLSRIDSKQAALAQTGRLVQRVSLPRRAVEDCLGEELRHLDEDAIYGGMITVGFPKALASMTIKSI